MNKEDKKSKDDLNKTKLFHREALRQYDLEMDSYRTLTGKANSLLASVGTILTVLTIAVIQIIVTKEYSNFLSLIGALVIPYIFLILSLLLSIESYRVSELATINPQNLVEQYYEKSEQDILMQLISNISNDLEENKEITEKRTALINNSLLFLKIGMLSLVVVVAIYLIIHYLG